MPDAATTIIAVRHGETVWNIEGIWQGHSDSSLTDKGKAQAEALAGRLRKVDFHHLYSSDLRRTIDTARPIAEIKGIEIKADHRLRENRSMRLDGEECLLKKPRHLKPVPFVLSPASI